MIGAFLLNQAMYNAQMIQDDINRLKTLILGILEVR